jgi:uncharacterized membrane protein YkvA (DUF1232 family)
MANKRSNLSPQNQGFFNGLFTQLRLIWRLMRDKRVNKFAKLIPIAAFIYLISPFDFIPAIALPVIGVLDDAAIVWLASSAFIALCPDDVVEEHRNALSGSVPAKWRDVTEDKDDRSLEEHKKGGSGDAG